MATVPRTSKAGGKWMSFRQPSMGIGSGFVGAALRVDIDKHFGDWFIARSDLLLYLADRCISVINMRTDTGRGPMGSKFKPYAKIKNAWRRDPDTGKYLSDELGRRISFSADDPRDVVTLRSTEEVVEGKRMRDWLRISPARPIPAATSIKIVQGGGRKTPEGKPLSHPSRAMRCVETQRRHIMITSDEFAKVLLDVKRGAVMAFVKRRARALMGREHARAHVKTRRQIAKTRRAAKRAKLTAEQRHRQYLIRLKRMGIDPDAQHMRSKRAFGDVKTQYKSRQRQQRIAKR